MTLQVLAVIPVAFEHHRGCYDRMRLQIKLRSIMLKK